MKNQKGITLIALVITIIVLLILAGVSIAMLTGDNGLLTKSASAKEESLKAELRESVSLAIAEIYANKNDSVSGDKNGPTTLTAANISKIVTANNQNITAVNNAGTSEDSPLELHFKLSGKQYKVTYTKGTTSASAKIDVEEENS